MSAAQFEKLYAGVCKAIGASPVALETTEAGTCFPLEAADVSVHVCRLPPQPDRVHLIAHIAPRHAYRAAVAAELMAANAWLMYAPREARICRKPMTGDYVLRTWLPLDGRMSAGELLREVQALGAMVARVRRDLDRLKVANPLEQAA